LDVLANVHRTRRKPQAPVKLADATTTLTDKVPRTGPNLVELAHTQYHGEKRTTTAKA